MGEKKAPVGMLSDALSRFDVIFAAITCMVPLGLVYLITSYFSDEIVARSLGGRWFQSDGWRAYDDMVSFAASHHRANLRPLFSLITIPSTGALMAVFGLSPIKAVWVFNAACFSAWSTAIFMTCRVIGIRAVYALSLTFLAISSAAALYWFIVPETYGLSSMFLVFMLLLAAIDARKSLGIFPWIVVGGLVAGTLISNWAALVALSLVLKNRREAVVISTASLALFFCALVLQRAVFPAPASLKLQALSGERQYLSHEERGGLSCALMGELVSPLLIPAARPVGGMEPTGRRVTVQCDKSLATPTQNPSYAVAVGLWLVFLTWGCATIVRSTRMRRYGLAVAAALGTQVSLHLFYGEETFLYALHFIPMLMLLAAGAFLADHRRLALCLMLALAVFAAVNNGSHLKMALTAFDSGGSDPRIAQRMDKASPTTHGSQVQDVLIPSK